MPVASNVKAEAWSSVRVTVPVNVDELITGDVSVLLVKVCECCLNTNSSWETNDGNITVLFSANSLASNTYWWLLDKSLICGDVSVLLVKVCVTLSTTIFPSVPPKSGILSVASPVACDIAVNVIAFVLVNIKLVPEKLVADIVPLARLHLIAPFPSILGVILTLSTTCWENIGNTSVTVVFCFISTLSEKPTVSSAISSHSNSFSFEPTLNTLSNGATVFGNLYAWPFDSKTNRLVALSW